MLQCCGLPALAQKHIGTVLWVLVALSGFHCPSLPLITAFPPLNGDKQSDTLSHLVDIPEIRYPEAAEGILLSSQLLSGAGDYGAG